MRTSQAGFHSVDRPYKLVAMELNSLLSFAAAKAAMSTPNKDGVPQVVHGANKVRLNPPARLETESSQPRKHAKTTKSQSAASSSEQYSIPQFTVDLLQLPGCSWRQSVGVSASVERAMYDGDQLVFKQTKRRVHDQYLRSSYPPGDRASPA